MLPVVVPVLGLAAALVVLLLAVLTGLGEHRRGARASTVFVAALLFPLAWLVWYVRDELPVRRRRAA
ncbi:hypothetical protein [Nocardioides flavescens]|uniref:Uncharacterized protein n=1 Tax=Nocardioides flavescens TaxID=2691959 RepID=A0A6L7EYL9_9ACTN|nr:hypothetical protein [Nocardioides flavescens]MXG88602.1 hypothetical protein [Nocardioides flavescens]